MIVDRIEIRISIVFCVLYLLLGISHGFTVRVWKKCGVWWWWSNPHNEEEQHEPTRHNDNSDDDNNDARQREFRLRQRFHHHNNRIAIQVLCFASIVTKVLLYAARTVYSYENNLWSLTNYQRTGPLMRVTNYWLVVRAVIGCIDDVLFVVLGIHVITSAWQRNLYREKARKGFVALAVVTTRILIAAVLCWGLLVYSQDDDRKFFTELYAGLATFVWHLVFMIVLVVAWMMIPPQQQQQQQQRRRQRQTNQDHGQYMQSSSSDDNNHNHQALMFIMGPQEWRGCRWYGWMVLNHVLDLLVVFPLATMHKGGLEGDNDQFGMTNYIAAELVLVSLTPFLVLVVVAYFWSRNEQENDNAVQQQQQQYHHHHHQQRRRDGFTVVTTEDNDDDEGGVVSDLQLV